MARICWNWLAAVESLLARLRRSSRADAPAAPIRLLVTDVDGDSRADVIATSLPDVWWLEAGDLPGQWSGTVVASVPAMVRLP